MIPGHLNHSLEPYVWSNRSHTNYRQQFVFASGTCYLIHVSQDQLRSALLKEIRSIEAKTSAISNYAIAFSTRATDASTPGCISISGFHISKSEAWRIALDHSQFLTTVQTQTIVLAHRIWLDFQRELLQDIAEAYPSRLPDTLRQKISSRSLGWKTVRQTFVENLGINVVETAKEERELHQLAVIRNIIEHNFGRINSEYVALLESSTLRVGQRLEVTAAMASDYLDLLDHVVNDLNYRVVSIFPQVLTDPATSVQLSGVQTIIADHSHDSSRNDAYTPYLISPSLALLVDIAPVIADSETANAPRPNQIRLIHQDREYYTNVGVGLTAISLDRESLLPTNHRGLFSGFLSGDSYAVGVGHGDGSEVNRFFPYWTSNIYVKP